MTASWSIDADGYFMGVALADKLLAEGRHVTLVTPFERVAPYTFFTDEGPGIRSLLTTTDVECGTGPRNRRGAPGGGLAVHCSSGWRRLGRDAVLLVTQRLSDDHLYRELSPARETPRPRGSPGSTASATALRRG